MSPLVYHLPFGNRKVAFRSDWAENTVSIERGFLRFILTGSSNPHWVFLPSSIQAHSLRDNKDYASLLD